MHVGYSFIISGSVVHQLPYQDFKVVNNLNQDSVRLHFDYVIFAIFTLTVLIPFNPWIVIIIISIIFIFIDLNYHLNFICNVL